jgi:hypothetical protein
LIFQDPDIEESDLEGAVQSMAQLERSLSQTLTDIAESRSPGQEIQKMEKDIILAKSRAISVQDDLRQMIYTKPVTLRIPPLLRRPATPAQPRSARPPPTTTTPASQALPPRPTSPREPTLENTQAEKREKRNNDHVGSTQTFTRPSQTGSVFDAGDADDTLLGQNEVGSGGGGGGGWKVRRADTGTVYTTGVYTANTHTRVRTRAHTHI